MEIETIVKHMSNNEKSRLEKLCSDYDQPVNEYTIAIARHLEKNDKAVLKGIKETDGYKDARERLDLAGLSNYDTDFKFKKYSFSGTEIKRTGEIDYVSLSKFVYDLLGKYNENGKFIAGGVAQSAIKTEGIQPNDNNDPEIQKENVKKRIAEAKRLYDELAPSIDSILKGSINADAARYFIDQLATEHFEAKDKVNQKMKEARKAIPFEGLLSGEIVPEVWKRNPFTDMSYSMEVIEDENLESRSNTISEFYCCAFLGGANGVDDRNAAPVYFRNGAMSMVDFKCDDKGKEKRMVRAITSACLEVKGIKPTGKTYMLVDSVEGSDRVNPEIILDALKDYAMNSGFDKMIFYEGPQNTTPGKFVEFLKGKGLKPKSKNLEMLWNEGMCYIEAFNDWNFPAGKVKGYEIDLKRKAS